MLFARDSLLVVHNLRLSRELIGIGKATRLKRKRRQLTGTE